MAVFRDVEQVSMTLIFSLYWVRKCAVGLTFLSVFFFCRESEDAARAFVSYEYQCAEYLLGASIVDRDMGDKKGDELMKDLLNRFWIPPHNAEFCLKYKESCLSEVNTRNRAQFKSFLIFPGTQTVAH